ncbi:MAG: helix-turn-helix domain-containing protein [bacterium]|nr:helix-turn-helix domain-containing protein [bacterium]
MSQSIIQDPKTHELLASIDREVAQSARDAGCPPCGGKLDRSNYKRKPRGVSGASEKAYEIRESFCCRIEGCRKRMTPRSVRFLGRRVYVAVVVVLVTAMQQGVTPKRAARLEAELGISRRTLRRWRSWWLESFPSGDFWQSARGRFAVRSPIDESRLPASLLERFPGPNEDVRLVKLLCFLACVPASVMASSSAQIAGRSGSAEDAILAGGQRRDT